jgi:AcrR family transcriptional regulator
MGTNSNNPSHDSTDVTRQRIVAGARRQFFASGFRSVTMDELARDLGMSKKTVYAHFSTKAEIVKAMLMQKFGEAEKELEKITSQQTVDFSIVLQQVLAFLQHHTEEIQPPFIRDMRREAPELFQVVEGRRRQIIQRHFGKLFRKGQRAGLVRKDIPSALVVEILLAAVTGIMNPPKMAELNLTPKTGFSTIIRVVLEGVITKKER